MAIIVLLIIVIVGYYLIKKARNSQVADNRGQIRIFASFNFSPQAFYTLVEQAISRHGIKCSITRVSHSEGGMFASNREYLRISRNEFFWDICAAPYGSLFFISWRSNEKEKVDLSTMPYIGKFLKQREKTYFEMDTDRVFGSVITDSIEKAISQIESDKGIRGMAELTGIAKAQQETPGSHQIAPSN